MTTDFDHQHPFRLVFTGADCSTDFSPLADLVEWRNYQALPDYDFLVLKIGHHGTLQSVNYDGLLDIFEAHPHLSYKPVRFSVFADIGSASAHLYLERLRNFVEKMKAINPHFTASVAWVFDCLHNEPEELGVLPRQPVYLSYNLYLHHLQSVGQGYQLLLDHSDKFNGLDITSYHNNFEAPCFDNRATAVQLLEKLLAEGGTGRGILERLCPEYLNWSGNDKTFKTDIRSFCTDGYIVSGQKLSPLVYGSFDDFTLADKDTLTIPDFLLMTFDGVLEFWTKAWSKKVIFSSCFSCDVFNLCQSIGYYWNNIGSPDCSLGIDKIIPIRFDKR